ncbi:MAG: hypothetical protein FGM14_11665 [Flavobacteriales bacterium]|nr:hypothetical protein [Flavobacteriales bacterium]
MKLYKLAFIALIITLLSSCNKYEEGPNFSLSSKKSRLVGEWKLVKQTENGSEIDLQNINATAVIAENGTYSIKFTLYILGIPITDDSDGKWKFNANKTQVIFTETGATSSSFRTIIKLAENELKLKEINNDGDIIIATYHPN